MRMRTRKRRSRNGDAGGDGGERERDAEAVVMGLLDGGGDARRSRRRRRSTLDGAANDRGGDDGTETMDLGAPKSLRAGDLARRSTRTPTRTGTERREASSSVNDEAKTPSDMNTGDCERNAAMFASAIGDAHDGAPKTYRELAKRAELAGVALDGDEDRDDAKAVVADAGSLMTGVRAYFVNVPKKRAGILGRAVIRMGGSVCEEADASVTHVVSSDAGATLAHVLETINRDDVERVTPEWITESFKKSQLLPLAIEFRPHEHVAALPSVARSGSEATSSVDEKLVALRERKEREQALAVRRSDGYGMVWTGDLVDHEKLERSRQFFSCQPGAQNKKAMPVECNAKIGALLTEMAQIYDDALRDVYRAKQYAAAASALRSLNFEIDSVEQCDAVPMLKKPDSKIRKYVGEILNTGKLRALEELRARPDVRSCVELSGIHGVGPVTARNLFNRGFKSIADLRKRAAPDTLTSTQQIGLKYYEEFQERIPREEVAYIATAVREAANTFMEDEVRSYCVGSFRRGKATSGDIDVLVECKDYSLANKLLMHILNDLHAGSPSPRSGILTDDLQVAETQYMGVASLPKPLAEGDEKPPTHRRIDIKVYDSESFPTALLYFTGSDKFNRSMRLWAKRKGFNLQDKGLYADRSQATLSRVRARDERDIFEALGLDYVAPEDRNV